MTDAIIRYRILRAVLASIEFRKGPTVRVDQAASEACSSAHFSFHRFSGVTANGC